MPLEHGTSRAVFSNNVAEMIRAGRPRDQALAASFREQRASRAVGGNLDEEDRINAALRLTRPAEHRAMGGFSPEIPFFERREAYNMSSPYGFSGGYGSGRFDHIDSNVHSGAYVLPADVVSGLGEGNTLAGAKLWTEMLNTMPYGIPTPRPGGRERGPPRPPSDPELAKGLFEGDDKTPIPPTVAADGGQQGGDGDAEKVPVTTADGEITVSPTDVARVGAHFTPPEKKLSFDGYLREGHKILDEFVRVVRGKTIKDLKGLPGPKGSREPKKGHV